MAVWAIADLHLSFGVPEKHMRVFGPQWENYAEQIESHWRATIKPEDIVLIPGDISWALRLEEAVIDLQWIDRLPGKKLLLKGNHDYWWGSRAKVEKVLPSSCVLIQNDSWNQGEVSVGGSRLWDSEEVSCAELIDFRPTSIQSQVLTGRDLSDEREKIYKRELLRLEMSLQRMNQRATYRIAMTHYPPLGPTGAPTSATHLLEQYGITLCVFGHLHNVKKTFSGFGIHRGITYSLVSADYIDFRPVCLLS